MQNKALEVYKLQSILKCLEELNIWSMNETWIFFGSSISILLYLRLLRLRFASSYPSTTFEPCWTFLHLVPPVYWIHEDLHLRCLPAENTDAKRSSG